MWWSKKNKILDKSQLKRLGWVETDFWCKVNGRWMVIMGFAGAEQSTFTVISMNDLHPRNVLVPSIIFTPSTFSLQRTQIQLHIEQHPRQLAPALVVLAGVEDTSLHRTKSPYNRRSSRQHRHIVSPHLLLPWCQSRGSSMDLPGLRCWALYLSKFRCYRWVGRSDVLKCIEFKTFLKVKCENSRKFCERKAKILK